nr:uncharacterized protein LOC129260576 [Lytechinus pictus]
MDLTLQIVLLLLALVGLFNSCACGIFGPSLEEGPLNKTAVTGDSVSLICDLEDNNERTVMWYSYQTESYITRNDDVRNPMLRDRFSVNVNYTTQMYKLHIKDVQGSDAGTYECAYLVGLRARSLAMAQLTVLPGPTSKPKCELTHLPTMGLTEGDSSEVDVSCSWTSNYTGVKGRLFQGDVELHPDVVLEDRVIIRVDLGGAPPSVMFRCEVSLPELDWISSCTVDTESNPYIKVGINPLLSETRLGSSVSMDCYGQSSDAISEYSWRIPLNNSYQTRETFNPDKNSTSLVITGFDSSDKNVVVECEVSTENGRKASTVAVVNIKPYHHPFKSSRVIISLLAGLMFLVLICVVIICMVCSAKKPKKRSISRQRLLARKGNGPTIAYDTVAKYYQDGHLSLNLDSPSSPVGDTSTITNADETRESGSHKRTGSFRSLYNKPLRLPKKKSRSRKSFNKARSVSQLSGGSTSDSNVLYENISRTGSMSSLYSRFSTDSGPSAPCIDDTPIPPERRKAAKENVYGDDPIVKHSYLGMPKTKSAADAFAKNEQDDDAHDYMSIDDEESLVKKTDKPLKYVELDLTQKSPKDKKKPKVKWADGGVVYTELNI